MAKASTATKLLLFLIALGVALVLGMLLGDSILSKRSTNGLNRTPKHNHSDVQKMHHKEMMHAHHGEGSSMDKQQEFGLSESDLSGLKLKLEEQNFQQRDGVEVRFRILSRQGKPVKSFITEHEKKMHVIVARKDLSRFYHVHPTLDRQGVWHTTLRFQEPGQYRLFADFVSAGKKHVLSDRVTVAGEARYLGLPQSTQVVSLKDGYRVRLITATAQAKKPSRLAFVITKAGKRVTPQQYLGAGGHLVALRWPDLAYLHTHPTISSHMGSHAGSKHERMAEKEHHDHGMGGPHADDDMKTKKGNAENFELTFPSPARYRLFFQFQVNDKVYTAPFTLATEE